MSDTVTLPRSVIEDTIYALERYAVKRQDFERFESELAMLKAALAAPEPANDIARMSAQITLMDKALLSGVLSMLHTFGMSTKDLVEFKNQLYSAAPHPEPQPVKPPYCGSSHCSCIECVIEGAKP